MDFYAFPEERHKFKLPFGLYMLYMLTNQYDRVNYIVIKAGNGRGRMDNNLIKKVDLENGLNLELYDSSKKIAGDRWQVKLLVKIEIPVSDYLQSLDEGMDADDFLKVLGKKVVYERTMERNFIDNKEKEKLLNDFCDASTESSLLYLSTPNFPKRFIVKEYKAKKLRDKYYQP